MASNHFFPSTLSIHTQTYTSINPVASTSCRTRFHSLSTNRPWIHGTTWSNARRHRSTTCLPAAHMVQPSTKSPRTSTSTPSHGPSWRPSTNSGRIRSARGLCGTSSDSSCTGRWRRGGRRSGNRLIRTHVHEVRMTTLIPLQILTTNAEVGSSHTWSW